MSSTQVTMVQAEDRDLRRVNIEKQIAGQPTTLGRHQNYPQKRHHERDIISPPIKLNFSRPFSNPPHQTTSRRSAPGPDGDDKTLLDVSTETSPPDHAGAVHKEATATTAAQSGGIDAHVYAASNRINITTATASTSIANACVRKDTPPSGSMSHTKCDADGKHNPTTREEDDVPAAPEMDTTSDTPVVDEVRTARSDGNDEKKHHRQRETRPRSSSHSSNESETGSPPDGDTTNTKMSNKVQETINDAKIVKPTVNTSARKAVQVVGTSIKRTDTGVVMEDENIIVHHDSYSVVYKDTSKLYASIQAHVKSVLENAKKSISSLCEAKLKAFQVSMERAVKAENKTLRQSNAKSSVEDTHRYVIITPKQSKNKDESEFHIVTAANGNDAKSKLRRCKKDVDKLLLKFINTEAFNVGRMRDVFKERDIGLKSKNDFRNPAGDMKHLQSYLVKIFNGSKKGTISGHDYTITLIVKERTSSKPVERKRKHSKKKDAVYRSRHEEYTDDEGPADERVGSEGSVLHEDEGDEEQDYDEDDREQEKGLDDCEESSVREDERSETNSSSSDEDVEDRKASKHRKNSKHHDRKRSRRDSSDREDDRPSKKKRSRRD